MAKKQKINENGAAVEGGEHIMYFKNLSYQAEESDLKEFFSSCGSISKVEVGKYSISEDSFTVLDHMYLKIV